MHEGYIYPKVLYRADSYLYEDLWEDTARIWFSEYKVVKHTDCGVWVVAEHASGYVIYQMSKGKSPRELGCKWVSLTGRKRYAYPSKEEAIESLRIRKVRQLQHVRAATALAETTLKAIKEGTWQTAKA